MSRGPDSRRSVFITGAGGGLGGATARYLAARNWQVFAADFAEAALRELGGEENITTLVLDVTAQASVDAAVAQVARSCEGLDGIVNFAGILEVGSVIEVDPETIRHVLDVNVMGTVRVNHALFPLLLARKGASSTSVRNRLAERDAVQWHLRDEQARDRGLFRCAAP